MKYLLAATFVFLITLGLTVQSLASKPEVVCKASAHNTEKCAPEAKEEHHDEHLANMNSLFPEKQKIAKLSARPSVVDLVSPKFMAKVTGTAKLEWKAVAGANAYHVQVATDPNFKWLIADDHFVKTNSFEVTKTEAGQKYYWRVAAENTENDSMFTKSNFVSSVFVTK